MSLWYFSRLTWRCNMQWNNSTIWSRFGLWCTSFGLWNNMVNKRNANRLLKHTTTTTIATTTLMPKIETIQSRKIKNPVSTSPCHICHWRPDAILFIYLLIITELIFFFISIARNFFFCCLHDTQLMVNLNHIASLSHRVIWESWDYEIQYNIHNN